MTHTIDKALTAPDIVLGELERQRDLVRDTVEALRDTQEHLKSLGGSTMNWPKIERNGDGVYVTTDALLRLYDDGDQSTIAALNFVEGELCTTLLEARSRISSLLQAAVYAGARRSAIIDASRWALRLIDSAIGPE